MEYAFQCISVERVSVLGDGQFVKREVSAEVSANLKKCFWGGKTRMIRSNSCIHLYLLYRWESNISSTNLYFRESTNVCHFWRNKYWQGYWRVWEFQVLTLQIDSASIQTEIELYINYVILNYNLSVPCILRFITLLFIITIILIGRLYNQRLRWLFYKCNKLIIFVSIKYCANTREYNEIKLKLSWVKIK